MASGDFDPEKMLSALTEGGVRFILIGGMAAVLHGEDLLDQVRASEADILRDGFGDTPRFECLLAEQDGEAVGLALFFHSYSTFEGRSCLYLEDLYVNQRVRSLELGRALMARLAKLAMARGCARLELAVLDWNPVRAFYRRLGFDHNTDWLPYRLGGARLEALATEDGS